MTDRLPPEGWYANPSGRMQWWDGTQWTAHYQDPDPVPAAEVTKVAQRAMSDNSAAFSVVQSTSDLRRRSWKLPTVIGILGLLIGIGIGSSGTDPKSSSGTTVSQLDKRESDLKMKAAELDHRSKELDEREAQLDKKLF